MTSKLPTELAVLMHGQRIGTLSRRGRTRPLQLRHRDDLSPDTTPLSVTMAISDDLHRGPYVRHWLAGLLPDRDAVLAAWRRTFQVTSLEEYALLPHIGMDLAGAAQFCLPELADNLNQVGALVPLTEDEIGQRLDDLRSTTSGWGVQARSGRFSLAGAQAKLALHFDGRTWFLPTGGQATTHILKPAISSLPDQDLNEHLTMRTAANLGLLVPPTRVMTFADRRVLVVQRYDRITQDGQVSRIHQEDLVQASGRRPEDKYEAEGGPGIVALTEMLRRVVSPQHRDQAVNSFLDAVAFNWLTAGTDAHAKNYSLLLSGQQVRLAPLYDLNSFLPYHSRAATLSMSIGGTGHLRADRVTAADWRWVARHTGIDPDVLLDRVGTMATRLPDAASTAAADDTGLVDVPAETRSFGRRFVDAVADHSSKCLERLKNGTRSAES